MFKKIIFCLGVLLFSSSIGAAIGQASGKTTGEQAVFLAKEHLGVPYKMGGNTLDGFDCSGLILYVYNQLDIKLPRISADQAKVGTEVSKEDLQAGDLVFFKDTYKSGISHAGIYIGEDLFISATSSKGVRIDSINDPYYWQSRYAGARRVTAETASVAPSAAVQPAAGSFTDVPSSYWAYEAITNLKKRGIISGGNSGEFMPDSILKRSEAAKMLTEAFKLTGKAAGDYQDVPKTHWAYSYISAATASNYFTGYAGNQFKPDAPITRAEISSLLSRVFNLQPAGQAVSFSDVPVTHWAYQDIQKLAANKITGGYSDGTFQTNRVITRAEFATFLYRALEIK
jgi:peptidoglycan DL-endopeptidase CwlO